MSYDMKFSGVLHYLTETEIELAATAAEEILAEDDPDFAETWRSEDPIQRGGLTVSINIDIGAPGDWWFSLEALVETYAERADTGKIDSWYDGEENESYGPDVEEEE